jgi:hypothetical protein
LRVPWSARWSNTLGRLLYSHGGKYSDSHEEI